MVSVSASMYIFICFYSVKWLIAFVQRVQDPGISTMFPGKYPPYDEGIKEDVFIRNASGGILVGQVLC